MRMLDYVCCTVLKTLLHFRAEICKTLMCFRAEIWLCVERENGDACAWAASSREGDEVKTHFCVMNHEKNA